MVRSLFIQTNVRVATYLFSHKDISVENITTNSCTVVIPQATDDDLVAKYRVEISSSVSKPGHIRYIPIVFA